MVIGLARILRATNRGRWAFGSLLSRSGLPLADHFLTPHSALSASSDMITYNTELASSAFLHLPDEGRDPNPSCYSLDKSSSQGESTMPYSTVSVSPDALRITLVSDATRSYRTILARSLTPCCRPNILVPSHRSVCTMSRRPRSQLGTMHFRTPTSIPILRRRE